MQILLIAQVGEGMDRERTDGRGGNYDRKAVSVIRLKP